MTNISDSYRLQADPEEMAHFRALSAHWWDADGPLKTLHDINPARVAWILKYAALKEKMVLDAGCGGGILSESLAKEGAHVTAIDTEPHAIEAAIAHAKINALKMDYQCTDLENLLEHRAATYDIITCMEMLEHVPNPSEIVAACAQLLKPGGKLFFSTINRTWKAYMLGIVTAEYLINIVPKNTHTYDKLIRPSELAEWAETAGLSVSAISGLSYRPWSRRAVLSTHVDINYLMLCLKT